MLSIKKLSDEGLKKYFTFLAMGLVSAALCQTGSKDWWVYVDYLYGYWSVRSSWQEMWQSFSIFKEPLYFFSAKLFGQLIGFPAFIAITTITLLVVKLHFLTKIVNNVGVTCFFYSCLYLFLFEGTVLRAAFATSLIFAALYYLNDKKIKTSFLFVLTSTQIHLTAIVFFLMYPLYFIRQLNWMVLVFFIVSPFMIVINFSIYDMLFDIAGIFTDKYRIYATEKDISNQNSTGLFFYFIGFFYSVILIIISFMRTSLLADPFRQTLFSLSMLGVIAMCLLHDHVAVAARFGELFMICLVPLLSWLFLFFKKNGMRYHQYVLVVTFSLYGLARFGYLYPSLVF